ncbi:MAG: Rieske 2Fe-2S domain-containing protein [Terracidiphilus sp.]|jgi:nitrite reductase (NADH) small subunit
MSEFVRICSVAELPAEGEVAEFTVLGRPLCVAHVGGAVSVLDGTCPHEGGPLGEGIVEGGRVVCPWHAYAFDLHTGLSEQDSDLKAEVLEATVVDGEVRVKR